MARFDFINKQVAILGDSDHSVELSPQEALDLLYWLSDHRDILFGLAYQNATQEHLGEKELEIHIYQENLDQLDKLKAAIPDLHEGKPVIKVLAVPLSLVTERAIDLLKQLQFEYRIHPLLEEDEAFAQG
ncbi:MAG: hypothetical protein E6I93_16185 [Chloroflexi bacterium]|nr:MAG: hypothetical protein E6I93_16185 [Chloroflexota bacterium]TMF44403.1 MAG: hypothetical protein E6I32_15190 [Chloroflexota bacterium]